MLAQYTLELSLVEVAMNRWRPDLLACAAVFVGKKILKEVNPWSALLTQQTGFRDSEIRNCARELCIILNTAHTKKYYSAVYKKFSSQKFLSVAKICEDLAVNARNRVRAQPAPREQFDDAASQA